jgi:hypothetical protein
MAMAQRKAKPAEEQRSPLFKGHRKLAIYLKDDQVKDLLAEAQRRAQERGAIRTDLSEVIRDIVDAWRAKKR